METRSGRTRHERPRPPPSPSMAIPLISTSTLSRSDAPRSMLRRKPSTISQYTRQARTDPASIQEHQNLLDLAHDVYDDPFPGSIFGISMPPTSSKPKKERAKRSRHAAESKSTNLTKESSEQGSGYDSTNPPTTSYPSTGYTISPLTQASTPLTMSTRTPDTEASLRSSESKSMSRHIASVELKRDDKMSQHPQSEDKYARVAQRWRLPRPEAGGSSSIVSHPCPLPPTSPSAKVVSGLGQHPLNRDKELNLSKALPTVPPELAHLNIDVAKSPRPRRPSRDGTEDLEGYQYIRPIVHSDLSPVFTTYHKRTPSQEKAVIPVASPASATSRRRFGFSSRNSSRERPSPVDSVISPAPERIDSPAAGPGLGQRKGSRFGNMFRSDGALTPLERPSSTKPRKGPAAGTGHEGYGKFGFRGRTPSITADSNPGRSSSADSTGSQSARSFWSRMSRKRSKSRDTVSDVESGGDDLFKVNPVTIRGGPTHQDSVESFSDRLNAKGSSLKVISDFTSSTALPLARAQSGSEPLGQIQTDASREKDSQLLELRGQAESKTVRKCQTLGDLASDAVPSSQQAFRPDTAFEPYSTKVSSQRHAPRVGDMSEGKEGYWLKPSPPAPRETNRWNFFQRAHASSKIPSNVPSTHGQTDSFGPDRHRRQLAHYLMGDTDEELNLDDIERSVVGGRNSQSLPGSVKVDYNAPQKLVPYEERHSSHLPVPPNIPRSSLTKARNDSAESSEILCANVVRTSASPQIIDIPKSPLTPTPRSSLRGRKTDSALGGSNEVSSKRPNLQAKLGKSFSRPFFRKSSVPQSASEEGCANYTANTTAYNDRAGVSAGSERAGQQDTSSIRQQPEFFAFPERKNSELSYTSSSAVTSPTASTVVAPSGKVWHGDEEIWNEYNELIDQVSPDVIVTSVGSSLGAPFQYEDKINATRAQEEVLSSGDDCSEDEQQTPRFAKAELQPSDSPYRLSQFLHPAATPSTTLSISDILAGYGDRSSKAEGPSPLQSLQPPDRTSRASGYSSHYSRTSAHSRSDSIPETPALQSAPTPAARFRDTRLLKMVESSGPNSTRIDSELRFGALMTSKWLSFGRVLFSPAHNEARHSDSCNILIVDGSGRDWSHYCAMTYPKATFYNLAPGMPKIDGSPISPQLQSPNHRHVPHPSIDAPFPFPKGLFSAVVLRFPVATSDAAYHACIFECKRVLRPGGFLEISVLDLDLMNMGNLGRKAVRGLKMDMQDASPHTSLRNIGDTMMTYVGRRGFENIQRCIVGIPAAGKIALSQDFSNSDLSAEPEKSHKQGKQREISGKTSFADLLYGQPSTNKQEEKAENEGITKMVAKVGRWWYSTCYESALGRQGRSIWDQAGLIRECEKQGTSFRLLLCYAQKPTCPRRRTASV